MQTISYEDFPIRHGIKSQTPRIMLVILLSETATVNNWFFDNIQPCCSQERFLHWKPQPLNFRSQHDYNL